MRAAIEGRYNVFRKSNFGLDLHDKGIQVAEVRSALREVDEDELVAKIEREVLKPFDDLLSSFGTRSFGDVAAGLREAIISLEEALDRVVDRSRK